MKKIIIQLIFHLLSLFSLGWTYFHRNPPLMCKTIQYLTLKSVLRKSFPSITIKIKILQQVLFRPKRVLTLDSPIQWAQANEINSNLWPTYQWSRMSHFGESMRSRLDSDCEVEEFELYKYFFEITCSRNFLSNNSSLLIGLTLTESR